MPLVKKYLRIFLLSVGLIVVPMAVFAPPPCPSCPGGGGAPIDGGLTLLLAAGAIYGGRKVWILKNDQKF